MPNSKLLIETDILIAAMDKEDPHHQEARSVISTSRPILLSPYSLLELDLLIRSGKIEIEDIYAFWNELNEMLRHHNVKIIPPKPSYHAEAHNIREKYGLSYFDSLHAAVAKIEKIPIVSYDRKAYTPVEGLKYIHPENIVH